MPDGMTFRQNKIRGSVFASLFLCLMGMQSCFLLPGDKNRPVIPPETVTPPRPVYPDISGKWHRSNYYAWGELQITTLSDSSVRFVVDCHNGGHSGHLDSIAFWTQDTVRFTHVAEGMDCAVLMWLSNDTLWLSEPEHGCSFYHGVRASFAGAYTRNPPVAPTLSEIGIFKNPHTDSLFRTLVTDTYYPFFVDYAHERIPLEIPSPDKAALQGYRLSVPGTAGEQEAMIMYQGDRLWAMIIITNDVQTLLHFFTNVDDYVPVQMVDWAETLDLPYLTH
jgi:hypothetical protein